MQEVEGETNSAVQVKTLEPESPERVAETETPSIPDRGSVVRLPPNPLPNSTQTIPLEQEIPEDYWHKFDQMEKNQNQSQTSTLEYPIVDLAANSPMKSIPLQNIPTFHGLT